MEAKKMAINGMIEPDLLTYIETTFRKWQGLYEDGAALGTREISQFEHILKGAKLNSHVGFFSITNRGWSEQDEREHYTVMIYKNRKAAEEDPAYLFDTPILR